MDRLKSDAFRGRSLLFLLPTSAISGGVKVIFELANLLHDSGTQTEIACFAEKPEWFELKPNFITIRSVSEIPESKFDFIIVSNSFLMPMVLSHAKKARCVFLCQDYESFNTTKGHSYEDYIQDRPIYQELYRLPVPIITTSNAIAELISTRIGVNTHTFRVGLNKSNLFPRGFAEFDSVPKRILLIGNYLLPFKGMPVAFDALDMLSETIPIQLVLITQERRGRQLLENRRYPIEIHDALTDREIPDVMATCHALCCASFYEGLGLPPLEAFCCGLPVVCTRNFGVSDYGEDGVNLLLAEPNNAKDLSEKIHRLMTDRRLALRLREAAFSTVRDSFDWISSAVQFLEIMKTIDDSYRGPGHIEPVYLQSLLDRLEKEGLFTPPETLRMYRSISSEINGICKRIVAGSITKEAGLSQICSIRDTFTTQISNPETQYYDAFRAKFDLCQLLIGLEDEPEFGGMLSRIVERQTSKK